MCLMMISYVDEWWDHARHHRCFVGPYTSFTTRNGELSLVNVESCEVSWSGSNLCKCKMQSVIPK